LLGFCDEVLCALGVSGHSFMVVFVSARKMQHLNRQYRGLDYATDVLSFSYPGEMMDGSAFLGEIVIAPEVAWKQARRWRTVPEREVRRLLVHGILHLLGYDHETDAGDMMRLQRRLLQSRVFRQAGPVAAKKDEA
jgi:probable rRNA maturation factor